MHHNPYTVEACSSTLSDTEIETEGLFDWLPGFKKSNRDSTLDHYDHYIACKWESGDDKLKFKKGSFLSIDKQGQMFLRPVSMSMKEAKKDGSLLQIDEVKIRLIEQKVLSNREKIDFAMTIEYKHPFVKRRESLSQDTLLASKKDLIALRNWLNGLNHITNTNKEFIKKVLPLLDQTSALLSALRQRELSLQEHDSEFENQLLQESQAAAKKQTEKMKRLHENGATLEELKEAALEQSEKPESNGSEEESEKPDGDLFPDDAPQNFLRQRQPKKEENEVNAELKKKAVLQQVEQTLQKIEKEVQQLERSQLLQKLNPNPDKHKIYANLTDEEIRKIILDRKKIT